MNWGSWRRKSAFWSVLAADAWLNQTKFIQAQRCMNESRKMYSMLQSDDGMAGFALASDFMAGLQRRLKDGLTAGESEIETAAEEEVEVLADEDTEKLSRRRSRRASLIVAGVATGATLESAPLRRLSTTGDGDENESPDKHFG